MRICPLARLAGPVLAVGMLATPAAAAVIHGLTGEYWDETTSLSDVYAAEDVADGRAPDVTYRATTLSFPGSGGSIPDNTTLRDYFGSNASDYAGAEVSTLNNGVWRLTGWLDLDVGTHTMGVGSDDGFILYLDGVEAASHPAPRSFSYTNFSYTVLGVNPVAITLVWYENGGDTGMEYLYDGAALTGETLLLNAADDPDASPIPAPPSLVLLGGALAVFGISARRRRAAA